MKKKIRWITNLLARRQKEQAPRKTRHDYKRDVILQQVAINDFCANYCSCRPIFMRCTIDKCPLLPHVTIVSNANPAPAPKPEIQTP